ncbi:coatomer subunit delta-2-like isoform X2 [Musa acuminata AAA Group]|uniref:coatomer subunit delta-2-like isoform X2 n=1 Tax=Musa acuminata AAA Group TaxID=214697 RepID=UPI0031DEE573
MVVLAASIITKSGKVLVSRQFVDMSRIRIEGLLAAFPKLVGTGKQHTFVETENVRYVYQPIEALYLLLVTNKQSNILEDLDTLRLLSKLIEKNKGDKGGFMALSGPRRIESSFSDMSISNTGSGFGSGSGIGLSTDIESLTSKPKGRPSASATAPPKGLGMKLGKTQRTNQFLESLKAEGEVILEDVQPIAAQSKPSLPPTDPITLTIEERLNVVIRRDGGLNNFDIQGTLSLQILNQEDGFVQFQIENQDVHGLSFKTHPNINKELFNSKHIIGLKDPNRPFPTGQNDVGLMKWRIQGMDEASLPLTVNCWPSVSSGETFVNIEYEASEMFDLKNVVISIPLPALREPPNVSQIDGEWKYDSRNSTLEWSILLIDHSNRSGSMEFVVPPADSSLFFPIAISFTAASTYSDVKVVNLMPLRGNAPPKYLQRIQLITDTYQVI